MDRDTVAQGVRKIIDDLNAAIDKNVVIVDRDNWVTDDAPSEEALGAVTAERSILRAVGELFDENRDVNNPFDPTIDSDKNIAPTEDELKACIAELRADEEARSKQHPLLPFVFEHRHKEILEGEAAAYKDVVEKLTALTS
jgi:hypothetical protein